MSPIVPKRPARALPACIQILLLFLEGTLMTRGATRHTTRFRTVVAALALVLPAAVVSVGVTDAGAITGAPAAPVNLPATTSPIWQTNDAVWSLAYLNRDTVGTDGTVRRGGIVFAGGDFTSVRPPGSPKGTNERAMSRLVAFDATTGAPCLAPSPCPGGFVFNNPGFTARIYALSITPDGKRLFAGGDQAPKVFGYNLTTTGASRITGWTPNV